MTHRISSGSTAAPWPTAPDDLSSPASDVEANPTATATEPDSNEVESPPHDDPETPPVPVDDGPSATDLYLQQQSLGWATGDESVGAKMLRWLRGDSPPAPVSPGDAAGTAEPNAPAAAALYPTTAAALEAGDTKAALQRLNGLSMTAMLSELNQLSASQRQLLHDGLGHGTFTPEEKKFPPYGFGRAEGVDGPRIGYALYVVERHMLPPETFGDLKETGQVKESADFLAEKVYLPVAKGVNRNAAPHISRLLVALQEQGVTNPNHIAYVLASAQHESKTGGDMTENTSGTQYDGRINLGNTHPGDGPKYKGKGYVQLTGRANYAKYAKIYNVDLVNNPKLATDPDLAARIVAHGMQNGTYTGAKLSRYDMPDGTFDFVHARAIVNGDTNAPSDPNDQSSEKMGVHIARIAKQYRDQMHVA